MSQDWRATSEQVEIRPASTIIRQMALNLHFLEGHGPQYGRIEDCPKGWCPYAAAWFGQFRGASYEESPSGEGP